MEPKYNFKNLLKSSNRHSAMKFDFKYSQTSIEVLGAIVHKNKEQIKLLTTVYCKPTDQKNFLYYTYAHPLLHLHHSQNWRKV